MTSLADGIQGVAIEPSSHLCPAVHKIESVSEPDISYLADIVSLAFKVTVKLSLNQSKLFPKNL